MEVERGIREAPADVPFCDNSVEMFIYVLCRPDGGDGFGFLLTIGLPLLADLRSSSGACVELQRSISTENTGG